MSLPHSLYGLRVILIVSASVYTNMNCVELVCVVSGCLQVGSRVAESFGWVGMVLGGRKWFQVVSGCFTWFGFGWFRMVCCLSSYGLRNGSMEFSRVAFLNRCWHYLAFMDLVNGYSNSNLLVKEHVSWKSKIRFDYIYISCNFCWPIFLLWSIFIPPVDIQLKWRNPLCWAYPRLIFFRVNWFEKTIN